MWVTFFVVGTCDCMGLGFRSTYLGACVGSAVGKAGVFLGVVTGVCGGLRAIFF